MENRNSQDAMESRLQTEKVNLPSLSDAYKNQLAQKVLNSASHQVASKKVIDIFPYRYLVVAAFIILSFVLLYLNQPAVEVVISPNPIVKSTPKLPDAETVKVLVEKLNPDQIGAYASLILMADTSLTSKYQTEFQALSSLSSRIVTSFYDDFRPVKNANNN